MISVSHPGEEGEVDVEGAENVVDSEPGQRTDEEPSTSAGQAKQEVRHSALRRVCLCASVLKEGFPYIFSHVYVEQMGEKENPLRANLHCLIPPAAT